MPLTAALFTLLAGSFVAQAQLIDPNQRCVYRPGSTVCEPIGQAPQAPPRPSGPPYGQFLQLVSSSNIDIRQHPTYSEAYFNDRARLYCGLLAGGEMMKINQEVSFPPVINFTETPRDRPRLEVAILRTAALNYCPAYWPQQQQWEGTFVR
jgi:hypothetical protein